MNFKCILIAFGIFVTKTLADSFTSELKSHELDDYDVTTIYKLRVNGSVKCLRPDKLLDDVILPSDCYYVIINSRTNGIGMPIHFNGRVLNAKKNELEYIVDEYYSNIFFTNNTVEYDDKYVEIRRMDRGFISLKYSKTKHPAGGLMINSYYQDLFSLKISWTPSKTIKGCISLTYYKEDEADNYQDANVKIYQKDNNIPLVSYKIDKSSGLNTVVLRTNVLFIKNKTYFIIITSPATSVYRLFAIKRIAQCSQDFYGDSYVVSGERIKKDDLAANIYQLDGIKRNESARSQKECGPNKFGADCSGICSTHYTFCERMLFCTTRYGCSCASGYFGEFCDEKCPQGTYGVDCKIRCNENCKSPLSCDIYTGTCLGGCKKNYFSPKCTEKYSWLINPPQFMSSDYLSIKLNLSIASTNIGGSQQTSFSYYRLVYKQASSELEFQYLEVKEIGYSNYVVETIDNLLADTEYSIGAIIITKDGNYNDENINTATYKTSCLVPKNIDYGLKLLYGAKYINVTWKKYNSSESRECNINNYTLKLIFDKENDLYEEVNTTTTEYVFENLIPAHVYTVQVTAMTYFGPAEPSVILSGATLYEAGDIAIENFKAELQDSNTDVHLTWELRDTYTDAAINYKIKYKINRFDSCSFNPVNSNWTEIIVNNKTECDLLDLIPNSQYIVNVQPIADGYMPDDSIDKTIFVKTATSTPKFAPVIDPNQPLYVNNETATIKWIVDDKQSCMKLNGFLRGFHVLLKNLKYGTQKVQEIEETVIEYTDLTPNTEYELQVYIKTTKGFDMAYMLSVPFKTKSKFLAPVEELTVYKKNFKMKTVSVRWKYSNDSDINGFIIQVYNVNEKMKTNQVTIEPSPCKAWPTYYCTTVDNLTSSAEYTIKMKAKSIDYPTGGLLSSVSFNTIDGSPDEPGNLRSSNVGPTNITLEWDIPWMLNGVLKAFIINTEEISAGDVSLCCTSFPTMELQVTEETPTYNFTIGSLRPGSTYSIEVMSKTSWYGQAKKIQVTTLLDSPSEMADENNTTETN